MQGVVSINYNYLSPNGKTSSKEEETTYIAGYCIYAKVDKTTKAICLEFQSADGPIVKKVSSTFNLASSYTCTHQLTCLVKC